MKLLPFPALCLGLILLAVPFAPAGAHDYWLQANPEPLVPGERFSVHLWVGDQLDPELERPYQADMTTRFEWFVGDDSTDLSESTPDSTLPVLQGLAPAAGVSLLVMDRRFVTIESTVAGFLEFLEHEGQSSLGTRYDGVDPETPLTRRYGRSIKALLRAGEPAGSEHHDRVTGQQVEIRLLQPPHALPLGAPLDVHVQFEGKDLAEQVVTYYVLNPQGDLNMRRAKTDRSGRVRFVMDQPGRQVLRVAHLRQCTDCGVDWDTCYGVFSFVYP